MKMNFLAFVLFVCNGCFCLLCNFSVHARPEPPVSSPTISPIYSSVLPVFSPGTGTDSSPHEFDTWSFFGFFLAVFFAFWVLLAASRRILSFFKF